MPGHEEPYVDGEQSKQPITARQYFYQDFCWEDLRDIVQPQGMEDQPINLGGLCGGDHNVRAWDKFHQVHAKHDFFKERRYLVKEFPDLVTFDRALNVLEIGCGTGSTVLPILRDFVLRKACKSVGSAMTADEDGRFFPFVCDISSEKLPGWLCCSSCIDSSCHRPKYDFYPENGNQFHCVNGMDIVTMIFTLSAIPPQYMHHVVKECFSVLKPGGSILFRDYGLYDMTMQRFSARQKVGERLYQRCDGTYSYFFTPDVLSSLFKDAGFVEEENHFCCVELKNHQKQIAMKRVWIHAKFVKPDGPAAHT
ncbi:hypothetical protein KP509_01G108500 [Ceratopteris richardii]|uniref:Methyltransferase-like protein n=1 Tax=Ceratopteris richardii TaxID=49495 RepID=A0A8T2VG47_CERRI|nr:hypothetical protein KP509_01G108500 [Ceratopteris richardii]